MVLLCCIFFFCLLVNIFPNRYIVCVLYESVGRWLYCISVYKITLDLLNFCLHNCCSWESFMPCTDHQAYIYRGIFMNWLGNICVDTSALAQLDVFQCRSEYMDHNMWNRLNMRLKMFLLYDTEFKIVVLNFKLQILDV